MTIKNYNGIKHIKFESLNELQQWAKYNISNKNVLLAVMAPLNKD